MKFFQIARHRKSNCLSTEHFPLNNACSYYVLTSSYTLCIIRYMFDWTQTVKCLGQSIEFGCGVLFW